MQGFVFTEQIYSFSWIANWGKHASKHHLTNILVIYISIERPRMKFVYDKTLQLNRLGNEWEMV